MVNPILSVQGAEVRNEKGEKIGAVERVSSNGYETLVVDIKLDPGMSLDMSDYTSISLGYDKPRAFTIEEIRENDLDLRALREAAARRAEEMLVFTALADMGYTTAERLYLCGDATYDDSWRDMVHRP